MSVVVVARQAEKSKAVFQDRAQCKLLVQHALRTLSGGGDETGFLKKLLGRGVVGMKTNCLAARNPSSRSLVEAVAELVAEKAAVRDNDLIIWERTNRELTEAGYPLNVSSSGIRCLGTDTGGVEYDDRFFEAGKVNTLVSRVITEMIDHSVNVPILKDHSIAGMSGALKNMFGAIRNPNKYHTNNCDPYVADVNNLEPLKAKHRLTVIDALMVQYDKGPGFDPRYMNPYGGVVVSDDPVAADRVALEIMNRCRAAGGRATLSEEGRPVRYLVSANAVGLGECDLNRIDLRVVSVDAQGKECPGVLF